MAFIRSIHFRFRRLFLSRRRTCVVLAVLSFIGYFIFFAAPDVRFSISVVENTSSANVSHDEVSHDCVCATTAIIEDTTEDTIVKQTEALTPEPKLKHDFSTFFGSLNVHMWSEICGMSVDTLRNWPHFPYFPDKRFFISEFRKTQVANVENSGERIFGFVHPQVSGMYKFAITSDDTSELWLSRNEDPASSEMIARVYSPHASAWTDEGDYKKYPEQISKEILLHAGKKYYIESLSKQGSGATHVAVYWSYRNTTFEIISSRYLSNFSAKSNHETVPRHPGRQNNSFHNKSNLYYFYRLPLFNKSDYINSIPSCPYSPSFLVRRKLNKYEAAWNWMANESHVFPQDDTDMIKSDFRPYWTKPNALADNNRIKSVVDKFVYSLGSWKYSLKKIHKVIHKPDPKNGDRFLLNLELGLEGTNQSFRLSEHVYQKKGIDTLCLPEGINWNNNATVYFILPVKEQGKWVRHFINQLTDASLLTGDTNFHVIVVDFESEDIDMGKAFNTTLLRIRHTIVSLTGRFFKTLALNKAVEQVPNAHDIVFLFDLHIDVPPEIMDSVRMNTIAGRMAYFPVVGRLDCGSSSALHRGFWQVNGYGIMAVYKSDWDRFGGMNTKDFQFKWGGEDWDLLDRVMMLPLEVERIKHPGLYHHYHAKQRKWN